MACTFGIIEVALVVGLKPHGELVEMLGDLVVAVEAFVEVCFTIAIQVYQLYNLITAAHKDLIVDDFESEWLE